MTGQKIVIGDGREVRVLTFRVFLREREREREKCVFDCCEWKERVFWKEVSKCARVRTLSKGAGATGRLGRLFYHGTSVN